MQRLVLERIRIAHLDERARVEHVHAVGDRERDTQVVRDQDEPHPARALHRLEQLQDLSLGRHVECRRRLVGDQELRVACERGGEPDALPHAARELERVAVGCARLGDADLGEPRDRVGPCLRAPERLRTVAQHLLEMTAAPQDGVQHRERVLEDHRDPVAAEPARLTRAQREDVRAVERHPLRGRLDAGRQEPDDRARGQCLAAARLADDRDRLAAVHVQADVGDERPPHPARRVLDAQALDLEQARHQRPVLPLNEKRS